MQKKIQAKHSINLTAILKNLGFTPQEASIYLALYRNGPLTVSKLATVCNILPSAAYRSCRRLEDLGVIGEISQRPRRYQVVGGVAALRTLVDRQRIEKLQQLAVLEKVLKPGTSTSETRVDLVENKQTLYDVSLKLIKQAKNEAFIVSVGENIPPKLMLVNKEAADRGVDLRFIAHRFDTSNENALRALKLNGVKVRYYPDWGFHLLLVDQSVVVLGVSNPKNRDERTAVLLYNTDLTRAIRQYYLDTWEKAYEVDV